MIKSKMYRYLGRNGTITSPVLVDPTTPIPMVSLVAEKGHVLTNGVKTVYSIIVFEDEVADWTEIDDIGQK
jgi:hypothetical protein